jgi:hypothetical protein
MKWKGQEASEKLIGKAERRICEGKDRQYPFGGNFYVVKVDNQGPWMLENLMPMMEEQEKEPQTEKKTKKIKATSSSAEQTGSQIVHPNIEYDEAVLEANRSIRENLPG